MVKKINAKGFTLLEMLIAITIISIFSLTLSVTYISMTKGLFKNSDKNDVLYTKQRMLNIIKKDIVYNSQIQILDGDNNPVVQGTKLKITQPNATVIIYSFQDGALSKDPDGYLEQEPIELLDNLENITFELKKDENDKNQFIEINGSLIGKTRDVDIDFNYILEIPNNKWDFEYNYPD